MPTFHFWDYGPEQEGAQHVKMGETVITRVLGFSSTRTRDLMAWLDAPGTESELYCVFQITFCSGLFASSASRAVEHIVSSYPRP